MLPPPLRWTSWALVILMIVALALVLCFAVATQVTDMALRDALGITYVYGTWLIVWPAIFAVCLSIAEQVWRHFRG